MGEALIQPEMTVREVVERWPATRAVFCRYGIPTETAPSPTWETVEQAAAAHGHWAADQLVGELNRAVEGEVNIQASMPLVEIVTIHSATRAVFERYGIPCPTDRIAPWETIEQAAAARGHWAADSLLDELNEGCA